MKNYINLSVSVFILLSMICSSVYAQQCFDFEQPDSGTNWQGNTGFGIGNLQVKTSPGTNTTNHLYFEDRSGASIAVNNVDFDGNWETKGKEGCLCFDYRVNWNSTNSTDKKGPNFIIYRIDSGISQINSVADWQNFASNGNYAGVYAYFIPNPANPTIPKDQWLKYCLPIKSVNGQIPSNAYGSWGIRQSIPGSGTTPNSVVTLSGSAANTAWSSLITNVEGVILGADYHGTPNEEISFDNFCWSCTDNPPPPPPPNDPQLCCEIPDLQVSIRKPRFGSDQLSLAISGITTPIQEIEVAVVDYHYTYGNPECKPANLGIFGTLSSSQNNLNGLNLSGNGNQVISWTAGSPAVFNGQIPIKISKPNILKLSCCKGTFNVCLKVKVVDVNCNVCEKLVCIELPLEEQKIISNDLPSELPGSATNSGPVLNDDEVYNPVTGKIWLNKNLGASQVATSPTDTAAYGDLYQWGRLTDGHEKRTSTTTSTLSNTDVPGHNKFILHPNYPKGWETSLTNNLWQGLNGTNNPCPSGYRIPTILEWEQERLSWGTNDASGAFTSLKLPLAGFRSEINGQIFSAGVQGSYWSQDPNGGGSQYLYFNTGSAGNNFYGRATGASVRCIKN